MACITWPVSRACTHALEVVGKADSGKDTTEDTALGGNSEFALASSAVISAIMKIKIKAQ